MDRKYLLPGEYHVTKKQMSIDTLLGSCVSVCLYNIKNKFAAMNHFLLAEPNNLQNENIERYGTTAIEHITKTLMSVDSNPYHYHAQIFGGAAVVDVLKANGNIGKRNIEIAEKVLDALHIRITDKNVGGTQGRRIKFNTATNTVQCKYTGQSDEGKRLAKKRKDLAGRKKKCSSLTTHQQFADFFKKLLNQLTIWKL